MGLFYHTDVVDTFLRGPRLPPTLSHHSPTYQELSDKCIITVTNRDGWGIQESMTSLLWWTQLYDADDLDSSGMLIQSSALSTTHASGRQCGQRPAESTIFRSDTIGGSLHCGVVLILTSAIRCVHIEASRAED